jgi:outer membrane protein assembly factor BamB
MFGRCPNHNGTSPFVGAQTAHLKWSFSTGGYVDGSPVIAADGTVYIGNSCMLFALDGASGTLKWSAGDYYCTQESSPAIAADGSIIVLGSKGLSALDPATGQARWSYSANSLGDSSYDNTSSPTIGPDGTIYVSDYHYLYAVDSGGHGIWTYTAPATENLSTPSLGPDGSLYVGSWSGTFIAVDSATGMLRWSLNRKYCDSRLSTAAVDPDNNLYFTDGCSHTLSLVGATGVQRWSAPGYYMVSPSYQAGTVYAGGVYSRSAATGAQNWYFNAACLDSKPAVDAEGTAYVGAYDNALHAIDKNGHEKWHFDTGYPVFASPAIGADGTIYLGAEYHVYAIGP